ncbi:MAG: DUF5678 domain-containing protein [Chloroflexota bacterium]
MPQTQVIGPELAQELDNYKGSYVAIDGQHVVAAADSVPEARQKAREKGVDDPLFFFVPEHPEQLMIF